MKSIYRVIYALLIPLIALPLLYVKLGYDHKLYAKHSATNEISNFDTYSAFTNQIIGDSKSAELYCFFSIDCPHCLQSAITLNAMYESGNFPKTKFIFRASKEQMEQFVTLNEIAVPHYYIESQMDFDQLTGTEFPYIVLKKGKNLAHLWQGEEVNNWVFDFIKSTVQ